MGTPVLLINALEEVGGREEVEIEIGKKKRKEEETLSMKHLGQSQRLSSAGQGGGKTFCLFPDSILHSRTRPPATSGHHLPRKCSPEVFPCH